MGLSTQIPLAGQSQGFCVEILFLGSKWAKESLREAAFSHFNPQGNRQEKRRALQIAVEELHATAENYPDLSLSNGEMGALHSTSLGNHIQTCREYWFKAFISKNSSCLLHQMLTFHVLCRAALVCAMKRCVTPHAPEYYPRGARRYKALLPDQATLLILLTYSAGNHL